MLLRRILLAVVAVMIVLAPVAKPVAAALLPGLAGSCHCHDCDEGPCQDTAGCAQACITVAVALPADTDMGFTTTPADILPPARVLPVAGLAWPPPLQPPTT